MRFNQKRFNINRVKRSLKGRVKISPIPSMLSSNEAIFYQWLGQEYYSGIGEVVDAGCWLGSSTFFIHNGLRQNVRFNGHSIYAFDWFKWDKTHNSFLRNKASGLKEGEDFKFLTQKFLNSIISNIVLEKIDYSISPNLNAYWSNDKKIEILIIDAAKSPNLLLNILKGYMNHCIPNKTIMFFQDYSTYFCWFIAPMLYELRNHLEPCYFLNGGGVGFKFISIPDQKSMTTMMSILNNKSHLLSNNDKAANIAKSHNDLNTHFAILSNAVGVYLHANRVTEVFFGRESEFKKIRDVNEVAKIEAVLNSLDKIWPIFQEDSKIQNIYRRIEHAKTGNKDLTISYRSVHVNKRQFFKIFRPKTYKRYLRLFYNTIKRV